MEEIPHVAVPEWVRESVRLDPVTAGDFSIPWRGGRARVIGLVPGEILTEALVEVLARGGWTRNGRPDRDLAKIAVPERHLGTGRVGLGFVRGFRLRRGAFGSTVAHDAYNVSVVGVEDAAMATVVERLRELGGSIVVADEFGVLAELPLPVAGLLSDRPLAEVLDASRAVTAAAASLGVTCPAPAQVLAFLSLSVIPSLKITDRGLVDVVWRQVVPLSTGDEAAYPAPPAPTPALTPSI